MNARLAVDALAQDRWLLGRVIDEVSNGGSEVARAVMTLAPAASAAAYIALTRHRPVMCTDESGVARACVVVARPPGRRDRAARKRQRQARKAAR